jgi:hypothetical protein
MDPQQDQKLNSEQKLEQSKIIIRLAATNLQNILNQYSNNNKVIILQKQMIASDIGTPLLDITNEIENQINQQINIKESKNGN